MKKLELSYCGIQEMDITETTKINGGIAFLIPAIVFNVLLFSMDVVIIGTLIQIKGK